MEGNKKDRHVCGYWGRCANNFTKNSSPDRRGSPACKYLFVKQAHGSATQEACEDRSIYLRGRFPKTNKQAQTNLKHSAL